MVKNQVDLANSSYENQRRIQEDMAIQEYSKSFDYKPQVSTKELMQKAREQNKQ